VSQILFLSGKGGTGKTSLAGAFAYLMPDKILADCDVDAANLHLLFSMSSDDRGSFVGSNEAILDESLCITCGRCVEVCRFHAIHDPIAIDPLLCEGCGACETVCPVDAITLKPRVSGHWIIGSTPVGPIVTAELLPGEEASGKLVTEVKRRAAEVGATRGITHSVIDGSPGIGCPVIASTSGVDLAVLVTEPSLSGMHDLERILAVVRHFGIDAGVVINKWDLSPETAAQIERFSNDQELEVLGRIPYDAGVPEALVEKRHPISDPGSRAGTAMREIVRRVGDRLDLGTDGVSNE